ncbi:MAG: MFS transporter [Bryobacteraceae bacterium]|jgi:AAHS family 4-hydroxybenzoate transporter-like MFS transporter
MAEQRTIDVSEIIERQKFSGFLLVLVAVSWIITFFDGFDTNLISFAAPYFASGYHLSRVQLGNIFAMGLLGTLIGGFILGYVGDRIGRRPTVILATAGFGVLTLCFTFASGYWSLFSLRLINGIPLGGMLPLAWALNMEYVPKRYRSTVVTVIMMGFSVGTGFGGPIAVWLIPKLGWKAVFILGGLAALVCSVILFAVLPESIRFLASKGREPGRIAAILGRIAPGESFPPQASYVVADEPTVKKDFKPSLLFLGELKKITPLIWLAYIASSFAVYFLVNWTPLVFEALKFSRGEAATAASLISLMGAIGGLFLMRFTDRRGAMAVTVMPVMTLILLLVASFVNFPHRAFLVLIACIGFFLVGGQFGVISVCGIFYPSAYRANGAGWASSVAKIGSVMGPLVGGWVLSTSLPVRNIFAVLAVCPAIFAICIYIVGKMHSRMLGREALVELEQQQMGAVSGAVPGVVN